MRHVKKISVAKANVRAKDTDPAGLVFLQLWFMAMAAMLSAAFGSKD
ncbi:MAG TPA: hypothetical protein VMZ06_11635 [Candidatus Bathyarchaeia archaeon]|nr:hypothetical protein [Candidatus Bathyarchaeia archaeon]